MTNILAEPLSAFFIFIHPVHALILSNFDGTRTLNKIIKDPGVQSSVPEDKILKIIEPLIGNEKEVSLIYISFPENLIVEKKMVLQTVHSIRKSEKRA